MEIVGRRKIQTDNVVKLIYRCYAHVADISVDRDISDIRMTRVKNIFRGAKSQRERERELLPFRISYTHYTIHSERKNDKNSVCAACSPLLYRITGLSNFA